MGIPLCIIQSLQLFGGIVYSFDRWDIEAQRSEYMFSGPAQKQQLVLYCEGSIYMA